MSVQAMFYGKEINHRATGQAAAVVAEGLPEAISGRLKIMASSAY